MKSQMNSPLRYPGGKSVLTDFLASFITANKIDDAVYIEPYCGGSGAAINLLLSNKVSSIWLNDASYSIYSFWASLKYFGDDFLKLVNDTEVSLSEWHKQREIFHAIKDKPNEKMSLLSNGFATFYLNRCNRSGILNAGPIGGQNKKKQLAAKYKIGARFNKKNLLEKLRAIIDKRDFINVSNEDAIDFLKNFSNSEESDLQEKSVVYLDPPYYKQGSTLYLNFYNPKDHQGIAKFLQNKTTWKWILSYDNVKEIRDLYYSFPQYSFYINYSAQQSKLGNELLVHSKNSVLPKSLVIKTIKKTNKKIELVPV